MALPYDKMQVIYARFLRQKLIDQVALSSKLMNTLFAQKQAYGGAGVIFPLRYARNGNLTSPTPYANPNFSAPDGPTNGYQDYTYWSQQIGYSKMENNRALSTASDAKTITNYLAEKLEQGQDSLEYWLANAIFGTGADLTMQDTGNIVSAFPGLQHIISASNTVHGIAQGTYSWFQANTATATTTYSDFIDSTNANYVLKKIGSMVDSCTVNNSRPNMIVTTKLIARAIKDAISSKESFQKFEDAPDTASIGWQFVQYEFIPVVPDEVCPPGKIFVLNTDFLRVAYNPEAWFTMSEFTKQGDGYIADLDVDMCLICDSPRHQGIITSCPIA